jgi:hypothetical protein
MVFIFEARIFQLRYGLRPIQNRVEKFLTGFLPPRHQGTKPDIKSWRLHVLVVENPFRPRLPKRQGTGALQDASRNPLPSEKRASVLECGGPPPLLYGNDRAQFQTVSRNF